MEKWDSTRIAHCVLLGTAWPHCVVAAGRIVLRLSNWQWCFIYTDGGLL